MKKTEMIAELINVYDEVQDLRSRLARLTEATEAKGETSVNTKEVSDTDRKFIELGKNALANKVLYQYNDVKVDKDEDTDELMIETYKHWFNKSFRKDNIPSDWSYDQVVNILESTFQIMYEDKKNKAVQDFKVENQ